MKFDNPFDLCLYPKNLFILARLGRTSILNDINSYIVRDDTGDAPVTYLSMFADIYTYNLLEEYKEKARCLKIPEQTQLFPNDIRKILNVTNSILFMKDLSCLNLEE